MTTATPPTCRFCKSPLTVSFADLGMSPLSNSYLTAEQLGARESYYPLHARVCDACKLVQLEEFESPEHIFSEYAYFSSFSDSWLRHSEGYVAAMTERFKLSGKSQVVEIASNDGYLLQYFVQRGIPALGIEPAANVAKVAIEKRNVPSRSVFFGKATAAQLKSEGFAADLLLGNNVLAHVPDLNDFVGGMPVLLKADGVVTMEFPHLLQLMANNQFDTIYHEHFSYLSFFTVERVFAAHGLRMFDVDELPTHGGSIRIYACHGAAAHAETPRVAAMRAKEREFGLEDIATYRGFAERVRETKRALLSFLIQAKREGKTIAGYGAPAKGNTLLVYCGVGRDFIDFTVDRNPYKQGRFLPGTHIPILSPEAITERKPDYVFILPWNIKEEVMQQMSSVKSWGGRFVAAIPKVAIS